jgi:hypothetical protein
LFIGFAFLVLLALLALLAGAMLQFLGKGGTNWRPVEVELVHLLTGRCLSRNNLAGEEFIGDPIIVLADRLVRLRGSGDPQSDPVAHHKT